MLVNKRHPQTQKDPMTAVIDFDTLKQNITYKIDYSLKQNQIDHNESASAENW